MAGSTFVISLDDIAKSPPADAGQPPQELQRQQTAVSLDAEGCQHIVFQDLNYVINRKQPDGTVRERYLLKNVTGELLPGEVTAIAGQSGAGKSTLLDVLAGRIPLRVLKEGTITVNGSPAGPNFRLRTGYVMQDDCLFPLLTVQETFFYTSRLRLDPNFTDEQRQARVDETINDLGLTKARNTYIGDNVAVRGVSGGEKRRVSIGQEMLRNPAVLFLDEPTSGLDSSTALSVISLLREIARRKMRTIALTIHQPSARLLELLDRMIVLSAGNLIYHDKTANIIPFFASLGYPQTRLSNSLEFALDVAEEQTDPAARENGAVKLIAQYQDYRKRVPVLTDALDCESSREERPFEYNTNFHTELRTLLSRCWVNTLRTKELFFVRATSFVTTGILMGTLFLQLGTSNKDLGSYASYCAFTAAMLIYTSNEALPVYLLEREIFNRESQRGAYRPSTYALSSFIISLPFLFALALIYTTTTFFLVGIEGVDKFFFQSFLLFATLLAGQNYVVMFSAFVQNFIAGSTLVIATFSVQFLLSGFFISRETITDDAPWWIWLHYLSIFKYSIEGMMKNIFQGNSDNYECAVGAAPGCSLSSSAVLDGFGFDNSGRVVQAIYLIIFSIGFRIIFWLLLLLRARKHN